MHPQLRHKSRFPSLVTSSPSALRALSSESISSTKITAGCRAPATAKSVRTNFSPSPIHLEVRLDADMEKKVAEMLLATALPRRVLPVPGGPKRRRPLGGARAPYDAAEDVLVPRSG